MGIVVSPLSAIMEPVKKRDRGLHTQICRDVHLLVVAHFVCRLMSPSTVTHIYIYIYTHIRTLELSGAFQAAFVRARYSIRWQIQYRPCAMP